MLVLLTNAIKYSIFFLFVMAKEGAMWKCYCGLKDVTGLMLFCNILFYFFPFLSISL